MSVKYVFAILLSIGVAHAAPKDDDDDPEPKLSLPTEADRAAWTRPGFRLQLGGGYGQLVGLRGAPDGRLYAVLHAYREGGSFPAAPRAAPPRAADSAAALASRKGLRYGARARWGRSRGSAALPRPPHAAQTGREVDVLKTPCPPLWSRSGPSSLKAPR